MPRNAVRLAVGMACHNDFDGVYFSLQALRMCHREVMPVTEIIVIDNDPTGPQAEPTRSFVQNWVPNGRYVPFAERAGPAPAKNRIFEEASADVVVCIDSHVLLEAGSLAKLLQFYETDPLRDDLFQGPLLMDDLKTVVTHMDPVWQGEMYGVWGTDDSLLDAPDFQPREIQMHGLGMFCCRRQSWLRYNPEFSGFGAEEGYLHQKYRNHGRKTCLLPFLKWVHRFHRTHAVRFPLTRYHKIRNYLIGWHEVGLPLKDVVSHFQPFTPQEELEAAIRDAGLDPKALLDHPAPSSSA